MRRITRAALFLLVVTFIASQRTSVNALQANGAAGKLIVYGDVAMFLGKPGTKPTAAVAAGPQKPQRPATPRFGLHRGRSKATSPTTMHPTPKR